MKLSKFNLYKNKQKTITPEELARDFEVLRTFLSDLFPSSSRFDLSQDDVNLAQEINDIIISNIGINEKHSNNVFDKDELPFHTRDNTYLIKMLTKRINESIKEEKWVEKTLQKIDKKARKNYLSYIELEDNNHTVKFTKRADLENIHPESIKRFVETDQEFDEARNAYEVDLGRAQIKFMMNNTEPNGLLINDKFNVKQDSYSQYVVYHPRLTRLQQDADLHFYDGALVALKKLGISQHSAQVALEKYADLWRDKLMVDTYYNSNHSKESSFELWKLYRERKYYQNHKPIIDELGLATPNMVSEKQIEKTL